MCSFLTIFSLYMHKMSKQRQADELRDKLIACA